MNLPPDLAAFDERFKDLTPEEREEGKNLIRRYLELVVRIVDRHEALTGQSDDVTL